LVRKKQFTKVKKKIMPSSFEEEVYPHILKGNYLSDMQYLKNEKTLRRIVL